MPFSVSLSSAVIERLFDGIGGARQTGGSGAMAVLVTGTVAAVGVEQGVLGVQTGDGTKHMLSLADEAEITLGLQPAALGDLPAP